MAQSCECYKKVKYLDEHYHLDESEELEEQEGECRDDSKANFDQRENAVRLPGVIHINDSVLEYPDTQTADLPFLFQEMAQIIVGVHDYEINILTFWIIDVFLEGLRTAQAAGMNHRNQKATLHWMAYIYNVTQGSGTKLTRKDITLKLKLLLLTADDDDDSLSNTTLHTGGKSELKNLISSQNIHRCWEVPFPPVWRADGDRYDSSGEAEPSEFHLGSERSVETTRRSNEYDPGDSERNLGFMEIILEIIYRLFARLWSFTLIQTALRSTPKLEIVDLPFKLNVPKQVLKSESTVQTKSDKGGRKSISQRNIDETSDGRDMTKNDFILPLQVAEGTDTFLRDLFSLPSHESSLAEKNTGKSDKKKK